MSEIAAALPLQIICDMMGIPREDIKQIFELTNVILGVGDPEYVQSMEQLMAAGMGLFQYGLALAQDRLDNPRDDITSTLMHAEIEDENGKHRLTTGELGSFFLLLVVAGNETTRNAISHGMRALTENPDQRKLWTADFEAVSPTAVEEIVRWATPVINFRRTATRDTVVGGQEVKEGQKVVMFYNSANRDERAFDDPVPLRRVAHAERALRLRRRRAALLPRREPRPPRDPGHVRGVAAPPARHRDHRRARHAAEQLHPRHQAHALRLAHRQRLRSPSRRGQPEPRDRTRLQTREQGPTSLAP